MAYTQYAQSKTLAKDVPGAGKRGGKPSPTEGVTQFTDKTFADLVAATKAKTSTVNPLDIAGTTTVTPDQIQTLADKVAKDKKDKADKAIIALAEKAIADKVAKDKEFNAMESATYSDNSPATGGFTGYSGDYGGPDNDPSGFGGTGGYGMFNQGGLAGKKSKPKKKPTKRYKKGGLATSKK